MQSSVEKNALIAQRESLVAQRTHVDFELSKIDRRLTELCRHEWRLHQVAGEGRYCTKCGECDSDFDD